MDAGTDSQQRRTGMGGDLDRWRTSRREAWNRGDRHLIYTMAAILGLALLGAIIVPLSIPDAPPVTPRDQVLAEQYLASLDQPGDATLETVRAEFGADGGEACAGAVADTYALLLTPRPGGGTSFNAAAHTRIQGVHAVYCPERGTELTELVATKQAANTRARALAQREQATNAAA